MNIPSNLITYNYTIGNEFVHSLSQKEYQGYYYRIGEQFFVGKEFQPNAPKLIKKTSSQYNTLLDNPSLKTYSILSKTTSQDLASPLFTSIPTSKNQEVNVDTYYAKKININPFFIRQIDKITYNKLQGNPFYQIVSLKSDLSNLDEAEKQMPGLKNFLKG